VVSPENSRERITGLITGARKSLWLEEATLLDEDITRALEKAARRGVEVRFLAPRRNDNDVARENWDRLSDSGAQVLFLDKPYIHAKTILADGERAFVGSENLTFTSLELNRELGIITDDPAIVSRLAATMARDWEKAGGGDSQAGPAPEGVISWRDAERYAGQEVTVEGTIVHTYDSGKVTFLNFDEDYRNTLTIVIFPSLYDQFPDKPAAYFKDKPVQVTGQVKMYEGSPEIVIEDPAQIQVVGESRAPEAPASSPTPALASNAAPDAPIPWQDASDYVGRKITVIGEVVRTYNSGKAAFLNFDEDWRGKFSVVIFASDFDNFPQPPDEMYLHKTILVTGKVKEYKGAPEIIVGSPKQIEIVEEAPTATAATPSGPPKGVVSWRDAGQYVGQTITVEGRIRRAKDIGSITFLNFGKKKDDFVAIVRAEDYDNFPAPPAELYRGKQVWVTGEISTHKGAPQMVLHSPEQIEVFD
jgi:DNA/RNA endonuclease YhcR with UshA esterase domain